MLCAHEYAQPPKADSVCTICYTSGTTGMPKGAVLTHRNVVSVCSALATVNTSIGPGDIYLSFLPLAHMFERLVECGTFSHGGAVGFYR
jgi:long-chain acyl-CoA synthetase